MSRISCIMGFINVEPSGSVQNGHRLACLLRLSERVPDDLARLTLSVAVGGDVELLAQSEQLVNGRRTVDVRCNEQW